MLAASALVTTLIVTTLTAARAHSGNVHDAILRINARAAAGRKTVSDQIIGINNAKANSVNVHKNTLRILRINAYAAAGLKTVTDKIIGINAEEKESENGEKMPQLREGDIAIDENAPQHASSITKRAAPMQRQRLWPSRVIPYVLDSSLATATKILIRVAMNGYEAKTCLKFAEKNDSDTNWLRFFKGTGCWSHVGRLYYQAGGQDVSIGSGCETIGVIIHQLMHALGFYHEHSRPDRDAHVEIMWENIQDGKDDNFDRMSPGTVDTHGTIYDYDSVMHFGGYAFSNNGQATINSLSGAPIGQSNDLSAIDILEIQALYSCINDASDKISMWSVWSSPCTSQCQKSRQRFCFTGDCPNMNEYDVETETVACTNTECYAPIDGHWSRWSTWSACSGQCGASGTKIRTRVCDDPAPKNGGAECSGDKTQTANCKSAKCEVGISTEFEHGNQSLWSNVGTTANWTIKDIGTPSSNTGADDDHTLQDYTGHFIYIEASDLHENDEAILELNSVTSNATCKMHLWYNMFGATINTLSVTADGSTIFTISGNQGEGWKEAIATVPEGDDITVRIHATRGLDYLGDICVDDVEFVNCPPKRDGNWTKWGNYGLCSVTCGDGTKMRTRTCTNPSPQNGGADCVGSNSETISCNDGACAR
ncbi:uncharacterized protein LOC141911998 [Tubulanus polymorphus]|uniref:uncharacterized protein LOC141911998 n=1 Tax=Tubulanus polymorphus TaxID=672921 RepID=UPI003DA3BC25